MTTPHPFSVSTFVLLDGGVLGDMVEALSGEWNPAGETDLVRRHQLLDAARLRLYGEVDRSGWYLCTTASVRATQPHDGIHGWVAGLIASIDSYDDAPPPDDVAALTRQFTAEQGLDTDRADVLAHALLYEPVKLIVSNDPRGYYHGRDHDLPERLEIVTPTDAVGYLEIQPGEAPLTAPPPDSPLYSGEQWWVP